MKDIGLKINNTTLYTQLAWVYLSSLSDLITI